MHALSSRASFYMSRVFSDEFHDFVSDSSILEPAERPSAYDLLNSHPFLRQFVKKVGKSNYNSILSSFWSNIKEKKTTSNFKIKSVNINPETFKFAQQIPNEHINDVEWMF